MANKAYSPFHNGLKIPTDEVFIAPNEEELPGELIAITKTEYHFASCTQTRAIEGLKELALRHVANALVRLKVVVKKTKKEDLYVAKAKLAQVAVPIPFGEPSPIGTPIEHAKDRDPMPEKLYFSILETEGSAVKQTLNNFFVTQEEAKRSICARLFRKLTDTL